MRAGSLRYPTVQEVLMRRTRTIRLAIVVCLSAVALSAPVAHAELPVIYDFPVALAIGLAGPELATFVNGVLTASGAEKVDIVGYSQGGMMPRQYLKFDGGAAKVHALVALAPPSHGTTLSGLGTLAEAIPGATELIGSACEACTDQLVGSPFITNLNAGGDTLPGIRYTVISTRYDEVVTPYTSQFLSGPEVTNITLQSQCFLDLGDHLSMPYDSIALHDVTNALDPAHATPPTCVPVIAGVGG
jgi:hypothetical protein